MKVSYNGWVIEDMNPDNIVSMMHKLGWKGIDTPAPEPPVQHEQVIANIHDQEEVAKKAWIAVADQEDGGVAAEDFVAHLTKTYGIDVERAHGIFESLGKEDKIAFDGKRGKWYGKTPV